MTEQKLISLVIDEIIEHKLSHYRMKNREYSKLNIVLTQLGNKMQSVLVELSAEKADIINLYIAKHADLADKDCAFLYAQGAKDCVKLLKRLGVL